MHLCMHITCKLCVHVPLKSSPAAKPLHILNPNYMYQENAFPRNKQSTTDQTSDEAPFLSLTLWWGSLIEKLYQFWAIQATSVLSLGRVVVLTNDLKFERVGLLGVVLMPYDPVPC